MAATAAVHVTAEIAVVVHSLLQALLLSARDTVLRADRCRKANILPVAAADDIGSVAASVVAAVVASVWARVCMRLLYASAVLHSPPRYCLTSVSTTSAFVD